MEVIAIDRNWIGKENLRSEVVACYAPFLTINKKLASVENANFLLISTL